jgi:hypothetical protein
MSSLGQPGSSIRFAGHSVTRGTVVPGRGAARSLASSAWSATVAAAARRAVITPGTCPQVVPATTTPQRAQPRAPDARGGHTKKEGSNPESTSTRTMTPTEGSRPKSGGEDQEQTLGASQRVRGNTTPHPAANDGSLREPVKSASRPYGMACGHT